MSELKPCKCKICKCDLEPASHFGANSWQHWDSGECVMDNTLIITPTELAQWNALNNDTPALLRGARIGLDMAAKACDARAAAYRAVGFVGQNQQSMNNMCQWVQEAVGCAMDIRAITDTDIMKEISRE